MGNRKTGRPAVCALCGDDFLSYRTTVRYCSKRCAGRASRLGKSWSGKANPRFNGGLSLWKGRTIVIFRNGSHMLYSRAVMAGHLGCLLKSDEIIHPEQILDWSKRAAFLDAMPPVEQPTTFGTRRAA